ncbi:MAG: deoxyribodipyrimidine photo-lyase [Bacteroidota bacterium]
MGLDLLRQRTRRLNDRAIPDGRDYVLCWLQQALRAEQNPAIDAAIATGNALGLPVVVYHGLDNRYPYASHRLHRFILEASRELGAGVEARGLRFARYVRRPETLEQGLVYRLCERAAALVTDDVPTHVARWQADRVAARAEVPVYAADACCLVPMNAVPGPHQATRAFRTAHAKLRAAHLDADLTQTPEAARFEGDLGFEPDRLGDTEAALDDLIARCEIDMDLPPAPDFRGERTAALDQMRWAVEHVVPRYDADRNDPSNPTSTSRLSPWMHVGVLSPREVALAVRDADVPSKARWKFLDETLTWREFYHHLARLEADPAAYANVPAWARKTLADHAGDPRPQIYSVEALTHGETDDATWNAAQKQFLLDGWMHNNLRMYWVKQILKWRPTPEDAWATARQLNDRLSLDGRDPSTYGSLQWGFGRSKRGYREVPVYGWVPTRTSGALRKRAAAWLDAQAARPVPFRLGAKTTDDRPRTTA